MTERLLQYIWQFQYFNKSNLYTSDNQLLQVVQPGVYNSNQGPDFLNAKIKVGKTLWAGSVELHVNATEWEQHRHGNDKNYNNVILHVVWNNDQQLALAFPTLELKNLVPKLLLARYEELMQAKRFIACENQIGQVNSITLITWKERLLVERLQHKTAYIENLLQKSNQHWEEVFWWMLARNFGTKINSESFEKLAQSIPLTILAKHRYQVQQLEALLMGQAGLLDGIFEESYPIMLQKEYRFLKKKYGLHQIHEPVYFLRMRPANFPGVRLAQLAVLISESRQLFSTIRDLTMFAEAEKLFLVTANDYWHYHYIFGEPTAFKKKTLGRQMIHNIMINTVVPMLYAYGHFNSNEIYKMKALQWMEHIPAEVNSITEKFEKTGISNQHAFDSQALLHLKNEYCDKMRCLQCAIGNKILQAG